jgi:hypothetical protein
MVDIVFPDEMGVAGTVLLVYPHGALQANLRAYIAESQRFGHC